MAGQPRHMLAPLGPGQLRLRVDPATLPFRTTAELEAPATIIGQARALEALRFGVGLRRPGYHIYAAGPPGIGKHTLVRHVIEHETADRQAPSDWCHVCNFRAPDRPRLLRLPPGRGRGFRDDAERLRAALRSALVSAFRDEDHHARTEGIRHALRIRRENAFAALRDEAGQAGLALVRTPSGRVFAPLRDGGIVEPAAFGQWPLAERLAIEAAVGRMQERLAAIEREMPQWQRETDDRLAALDREVAALAVSGPVEEMIGRYRDIECVADYLEDLRRDLLDGVQHRAPRDGRSSILRWLSDENGLGRYRVNLLIDHAGASGAPVIREDAPTLDHLFGRIEHRMRLGALTTDFTLIKAGALQRANGGYLILDAGRVLSEPFAWEALKRALQAGEARIESPPGETHGWVGTVSLDPEPMPLDIKVILLGSRLLYYLLHEYDSDFAELFGVQAEFDEDLVHDAGSRRLYATLIAGMSRREGLLPFDRAAVARIIEEAARQAADAERLGIHLLDLRKLLCEADHFAREAGAGLVDDTQVEKALACRIRRADRLRERTLEEMLRGTLVVDTEGVALGQVNGISVIELGDFAFGQPSRITATARIGEGELVDIEREVETGGSLHSKGVLILGACLAARYLADRPLSIAASLVFEQSYVQIEGDSASLAELIALLSAIARVPLRQDLAVTGSVDQFGRAQAIGAVNEKIEGFFDLCRARGLRGGQGVIIPEANVKHLMLRPDVVEAAEAGRFHVWAVAHVDQAIELLTGMSAGIADAAGRFPRGSFNARVRARLEEFADIRHAFEKPAGTDEERD